MGRIQVQPLNWTTGANWLPVGAPAAGDDVVFNTGTLTLLDPVPSWTFNSYHFQPEQ